MCSIYYVCACEFVCEGACMCMCACEGYPHVCVCEGYPDVKLTVAKVWEFEDCKY